MNKSISKEIKEFRNLMKYSDSVKKYIKQSMYVNKIDWETNILKYPECFKFVDIDFYNKNIDGCSITFIIYKPNDYKNVYVVSRDENPDNDFYDSHICLNNKNFTPRKISKFLTSQHKILSIDFCVFDKLKNKIRYHDDPYYQYEKAKQKRLNKSLELKICKIMIGCFSEMSNIYDLTDEKIYNIFMEKTINNVLNHKYFKTLYPPIKSWKYKTNYFEIDYCRKRAYIEGNISFVYVNSNNEEKEYKYGNILPNFQRFQKSIYMLSTYDAFLASVYDSVLQIFNVFGYIIEDANIRMLINNITNNGFSNEILYKFNKAL